MNESLLVTMNQCVDRIQGTCAQYRTIRLPKQQGNREVSFPSNRKKEISNTSTKIEKQGCEYKNTKKEMMFEMKCRISGFYK